MITRPEQKEDYEKIRSLNNLAFGGVLEGEIVDKIRAACSEIISLVAVDEDEIVGHIFFSPVTVKNNGKEIRGMGLGPMAVLPERQRQGIGSKLVKEGLKIVHDQGLPFVIVLGHKDYYPRFGFEPASRYGLRPQWEDVPDEAFMVLVIDRSIIPELSGLVTYRPEFA